MKKYFLKTHVEFSLSVFAEDEDNAIILAERKVRAIVYPETRGSEVSFGLTGTVVEDEE